MPDRIVLHVDMDSFYAQLEERENPELKGNPVIVCMISGREGSLGAVATCNYAARKLGVHSGMPCITARKKAPDGVFIPARRDFYTQVSDEIMDYLEGMADVFEQVSVDEAFLDVSKKTGGDYGKAKQTAEDIKQHILAQQQLTCSVGIGPNKLVAKIASGLEKPDGLTVVQAGNAESFLTPLPIKKLYGIGPKAGEKLAEAGVETVGDIRGLRREELIKLFGVKKGGFIYDACRGVDERPVAPRVREQYSSLASFRRDTRDWGEVKEMVEGLSSKVAGKVEASGRGFKTITVAFITEDFTTHTKSRTLEYYAGDAGAVVKTAEELAKKFLDENNVLIRRLGVGVSNLSKPSSQKNITEYLND